MECSHWIKTLFVFRIKLKFTYLNIYNKKCLPINLLSISYTYVYIYIYIHDMYSPFPLFYLCMETNYIFLNRQCRSSGAAVSTTFFQFSHNYHTWDSFLAFYIRLLLFSSLIKHILFLLHIKYFLIYNLSLLYFPSLNRQNC